MDSNIDLTLAALHFSLLYLAMIIISGFSLAFGKLEGAKKKRYIFIVSTILFVLMAFRGKDMGSDTISYVAAFNRLADFDNPFAYIRNSITEPGYLLYSWLLSRLVNDARILFVVSAAFIICSVGRFANKYISIVGLFYCLLVGMLHFDFLLSGLRQSLALSVLLFAIDYLIDRRPIPFCILCAIAVSFHYSSLLFLVVYPLFSVELMAKKRSLLSNALLFAGAFISGFFIDAILNVLLRWFPKYNYYIGGELFDGEPRLAVFLKFAVYLLLLIVPAVIRKRAANDVPVNRAGNQFAILNLLVITIASNAVALMRFASLLCMPTLMHYSNEIGRIRPRSADKVWLMTLTLLAFYFYGLVLVVLKTPEWQTTYPIQLSWWIN